MSKRQQLALLKQGEFAWNRWRAKQPPDFIADLAHVFLDTAILDRCNLSRADLSHAVFWRCSFIGANLSGAHLPEATLIDVTP